MTTPKSKQSKHTRYDKTRESLPRLPSSRLSDEIDAEVMKQLYSLGDPKSKHDTKLRLIVDAARYALDNQEQFIEYRNKLNDK
jgi:hypothetical protein